MQHSYQRYILDSTLGLICSPNSNVVYNHDKTLAICGTLEELSVWNIKLGSKMCTLKDGTAEITKICRSPEESIYAVGYSDGCIRIWNIKTKEMKLRMKGHKKAISALCFNSDGTQLYSGSNDTDIVVWDLISERGLFRLKGHRDMVTCILYIEEYNMLLSGSKDTLLKIWSLNGQYCMDTYIGHQQKATKKERIEKEGELLKYNVVTGSSDQSLRLFTISKELRSVKVAINEENAGIQHIVEYRGCITVSHSGRTGQLCVDDSKEMLGYYNIGKVFMLYKIRSVEESEKKMKRRIKRRKEKGDVGDSLIMCSDVLELVSTVNTAHKITSFDFSEKGKKSIDVLFGLNNNSLQVYRFDCCNAAKGKDDEEKGVDNTGSYEKVLSIALSGHRSDVRGIALSSTDDILLSVGQKEAKMWTIRSLECIRSMDIDNGLCCAILPGDKHGVIGTKDGRIILVDLNTGDILQSLQGHKGSVWSIDVRIDGKGMVSGGADHNINFWEISFIIEESLLP